MRKLLSLFFLIFVLNWSVFAIDWSIKLDNCNTGKYNYNEYAGINCNKCGYHKDRLYLWDSIDSWDWFFNTLHKELIFSSHSYSKLKFLNWANWIYSLKKWWKTLIDLLPANIANSVKEAIIFIINWIKVTVHPYSRNKPAFIEVYHVRFAPTSSSGIPLNPPDTSWKWVRTKWIEHSTSSETILDTYREFLDSNTRYINPSDIREHNECYVWLVSWCWDGVTDSSYGEQCDNGTDNWNGIWDPTTKIKNWVVCNTSCKIVQPTCGSAAKPYSASDTSYGSDTFCWKSYETIVPANPVFPSKWWSSSWTCKLWNQTVSCSASRSNDITPPPGWWGW